MFRKKRNKSYFAVFSFLLEKGKKLNKLSTRTSALHYYSLRWLILKDKRN